MSCVVAVVAFVGVLAAVTASPAGAQGDPEPTAAQRCFEHHKFGEQPVDVAKTADNQTVLAQVSWGYHESIGCFLTLDETALAALQAAPPPPDLPTAETEDSRRCFEHHQFGQRPVDVAKTADKQTVLARLSWGYHDSIGCYLTLDNHSLNTLRTAADTPVTTTTRTTISAGGFHSCGIRDDGTAVCWGAKRLGQSDAPTGVFTAISAGYHHSCGIRQDGTAVCWGWNPDGRADAPEGVFTAISTGDEHSCGIKDDGTVACWGNNDKGRADAPEGVYAPPGVFTAISVSDADFCGIKDDGTAVCWSLYWLDAMDAPEGVFTAISTGDSHSCGIRDDGTAACWGHYDYLNRISAVRLVPEGVFTAISAGKRFSCGIRQDGTAVCWGDSFYGQLDAPTGVFTAISVGSSHSCGLKDNGTAICWGNNDYGACSVPPRVRLAV